MIPNLPRLPVADRPGSVRIDAPAGMDRRPGAGNGALVWTQNLTAAPLPGVRRPRKLLRRASSADSFPGKPHGIFAAGRLFLACGTRLYAVGPYLSSYPEELTDTLSDTDKVLCSLGERLLIWPDKKQWTAAEGFTDLEAAYSAAGLVFADGTYAEEPAEANSITTAGAAFPFRVGDGVTIAGCTAATSTENNRTAVIREISADGRTLRFYEHTFAGLGTEPGTVTLTRAVPDLDFLCTNENRVWGCKGDTVCCCKLGDPTNWNVFDFDVSTSAWSVESGTPGSFTGCVAYLGYPCFFKENRVFKVYGSKPSNFELQGSAAQGLLTGAAKSLAIVGETLIYLSPSGFVAYGGGTTAFIGEALGSPEERFPPQVYDEYDAEGNLIPIWKKDMRPVVTVTAAGADRQKYYAAVGAGIQEQLLVYDTRNGTWLREDKTKLSGMAWFRGGLWGQENNSPSRLLLLAGAASGRGVTAAETAVTGDAVFGPFDLDLFGGKYPVRLWLRFLADPLAAPDIRLWIAHDGGNFVFLARLLPEASRGDYTEEQIAAEKLEFFDPGAGTAYLPLPHRRCDSFALMLRGTSWTLRDLRFELRSEDAVRR